MKLNNPWAEIYKLYGKKKPNQQRYMKKQKFDTKSKTKKCTYCNLPGTTIRFGNTVRTLCKDHLKKLNAKHEDHKVTSDTFKKASEL